MQEIFLNEIVQASDYPQLEITQFILNENYSITFQKKDKHFNIECTYIDDVTRDTRHNVWFYFTNNLCVRWHLFKILSTNINDSINDEHRYIVVKQHLYLHSPRWVSNCDLECTNFIMYKKKTHKIIFSSRYIRNYAKLATREQESTTDNCIQIDIERARVYAKGSRC